MDYRQPIEPQIVILVTIGLFGFRDWTASAHSQEVEDFRQCQPGASDGLYIYRRSALPDEEFGGSAEDVLREKALPIPSHMPTMKVSASRSRFGTYAPSTY